MRSTARKGRTALDLYAGVGLFSLPLAQRFRAVTAVESGARAAGDLRYNAERAGVAVRVEQADAEAWMEQLETRSRFRAAGSPARRDRQAHGGSSRLSCVRRGWRWCPAIPATLARDLAGLIGAGYRIDRLTLVDLFPQTYHLETVARLSIPV